jgi:formylglycine-generating enzyme required for sulfatase activity
MDAITSRHPQSADDFGRAASSQPSSWILAALCLLTASVSAQTPAGMSLIPSAGKSFHMGESRAGAFPADQPVHVVQFTRDFYLGKTEVTYAEWKEVRDWAMTHGYTDLYVGQIGTDALQANFPGRPDTPANRQNPMTNAKFWDVLKWCNAKSEKEGRRPCFYLDSGFTTVMRTGTLSMTYGVATPVYCDWNADGYRLPTAAEWEYAARGGVDDGRRFPWGDTITHSQANYASLEPPFPYDQNLTRGMHPLYNGTSPVGTFPATGFGLYDMAGNVSEWCWDNTDATYFQNRPNPDIDPRGPDISKNGSGRPAKVARSGWYYWSPDYLRCAANDGEHLDNGAPGYEYSTANYGCVIGLRYAMTAQTTTGLSLIPSGGKSFHMGESRAGGWTWDKPVHLVQFTKDFYLGQTEVTYAEWKEVRDWATTHGYTDLSVGQIGTDAATTLGRPDTTPNRQQPVTGTTWWDVLKWCNARSEIQGRRPCYYLEAGFSTPFKTGTPIRVYCDWNASGFRLPTSAEWEYAVRGGVDDGRRFPWGDTITHSQANYQSDAAHTYPYDESPTSGFHPLYNGTAPVGSFPATTFQLYDMIGNVSEWMWDYFDAAGYASRPSPDIDPHGPDNALHFNGHNFAAMVCRGGAYLLSASYMRCGANDGEFQDNFPPPTYPAWVMGFRYAITGKAAATVTLGELSHTYNGAAQTVTATTNPAGLPVVVTYNGSATQPSAAGTYTVVGTINDTAYAGSATATLTILPLVGLAQAPTVTSTAGGATTLSVAIQCGSSAACQWQVLRSSGSGASLGSAGRPAATDVWVDIAGATGATYIIPSTQLFHGSSYRAVVTANGASATSDPVVVTVNAPSPSASRLLNLSTRALCLTGNDIIIPGFVISGSGTKRLLMRAIGPELASFGIAYLPDPKITLKRWNGSAYVEQASNDNWSSNANVADIIAAANAVYAFPLAGGSLSSALLLDLAPGQYTLVTSDTGTRTGVSLVELYDIDPASNGTRLINISNRGYVGSGNDLMIPGFVVSEEGPKTFLIRAVGPKLAEYGIAGVLADPQLRIYRRAVGSSTDESILTNDNWGENGDAATTAAVAAQVWAQPLPAGSKDAAFVVTLTPAIYTVHASGVGSTTGVALVEVYVVE